MEIAIEAYGLTKVFGRLRKLVAVDGLSMKIERGTVYGFIGPNGAGKTTTIKMLTGAISPTRGEARILGERAGTVEAKARIGYSPEHPNFYSMSAREFLIYNARICRVERSEAEKRADSLLEWMGLGGFRDRNARNFSAGMRQKLGLLQALIHDPEVLILDEPTANLDPLGRYDVLKKIRELAKSRGKTIFVSSHILDELEKVVDHVTLINRGKVVLQSDIRALKKQFSENTYIVETKNNEAYLKKLSQLGSARINHQGKIEVQVSSPAEFRKKLIGVFRGRESDLEGFYPLKISLENIFMKVFGDGNK